MNRARIGMEASAVSMTYLIGSLRNREGVQKVASALRKSGFEVFDDWLASGPDTDDHWREYELARGHSYFEAIAGHYAQEVFEFDKRHIDRADSLVLVMPAGKSGFLELGYSIGKGKPAAIYMPQEPERFDVMFQFAGLVTSDMQQLIMFLRNKETKNA